MKRIRFCSFDTFYFCLWSISGMCIVGKQILPELDHQNAINSPVNDSPRDSGGPFLVTGRHRFKRRPYSDEIPSYCPYRRFTRPCYQTIRPFRRSSVRETSTSFDDASNVQIRILYCSTNRTVRNRGGRRPV